MAPTMISVNATGDRSARPTTRRRRAKPDPNAQSAQTSPGTSPSQPTSAAGPETLRRAFKRNRSYQAFRVVSGGSIPSWAKRLIVAAAEDVNTHRGLPRANAGHPPR